MHSLGAIFLTLSISIFTSTFSTISYYLSNESIIETSETEADAIIMENAYKLHAVTKEDDFAFHCKLASIYESPRKSIWNVSKALYHWEQATKCDHFLKSTAIMMYATKLIKGYHQCGNDNCTERGIKRCEICRNTHYCSRQCQVKHWNIHKLQCEGKKVEKQQQYIEARKMLEEAIEIELEQGFTHIPSREITGKRYKKKIWNTFNTSNVIKCDKISNDSIYAHCAWHLAKLLHTQFNETQKAIELIINAYKYETDNKMKYVFCFLLDDFNDAQKIIDLLINAHQCETDNENRHNINFILYGLIKNAQTMLEIIDRRSRGDKNKFHHAAALLYSWNDKNKLFDVSKSFYHFERSIQGNHSWKSLFLYEYAAALRCLCRNNNIHQCDNNNCSKIGNQTCSKCKKTFYCSRQCQIKHWKDGHKLECQMKHWKYGHKVCRMLKEAIKIELQEGYTDMPYFDSVKDCVHRSLCSVIAMEYGNKSRAISNQTVHRFAVQLLCGGG